MKFDTTSSNENRIKSDLLKLNYYEFTEIYENLKKVENQLKSFKWALKSIKTSKLKINI